MYRIISDYSYIDRSAYDRHTSIVAQELLGAYIVRRYDDRWCIGRIVETECYTEDDPACHAYRGKTPGNASLFGPVGHAYVYISYGIHACLNVVAYDTRYHNAGGVLIRAVEPVHGISTLYHHRGLHTAATMCRVTNGPGKLTQAFQIDRSFDGHNVCNYGRLMLLQRHNDPHPPVHITPRIGISRACSTMWRYVIPGNPYVSR